ncbi:hypothetical protein QAD02_009803 [Eretmocerus hayati]|uniref:Uncharacterized protein n=1 Tax=Eretmocerus hayati TaxID=131215 RepID=A0ACC2NAD7_9HYME|nr:hypothetical protein QAD02_009803 [Eretmocerus hayati]
MQLSQYQKMGLGGFGIFIYSILFGTVILPFFLDIGVRQQVALNNGTKTRAMWGKFPFAITQRIWIFNVTNPDEIEKGEKPIVQEVGPFVYDEWQEKVNQEDRDEDDTVSYAVTSKYYFNEEESKCLTGDEEVIVPNLFILGMVNAVLKERPSAIPFIAKAIDIILRKPTSVFIKLKAKTLLFDGFIIDCNVEGSAGTAICSEIKKNADEAGLKMAGEKQFLFSLLGGKNDSVSPGRTRVLKGSKNVKNVGVVVEYKGKNNMSTWDDEYCDSFNGTDGTIFHPFFDEKGNEDLVFFVPSLCRNLVVKYTGEDVKWKGMKLLRYSTGFGLDVEKNPYQKCYCSEPESCLKKGVFDMYKCGQAPVVMSNPHFYDADPYYLTLIEGLNPDKEKHGIYMDLNAFAGAPLRVRVRVQINMFMKPLQKFKLMKNFPEALMPIFWMESAIEVPDWVVKEVKQGKMQLTVVHMFQHLLMIGGLGMCVFAAGKHFLIMAEDDDAVVTTNTTTRPVTTMKIDVKEVEKSAEIPQMSAVSVQSQKNEINLRPAALPSWAD